MTLRLSEYLQPGAAYHVARVTPRPAPRNEAHTHDFAEVFWVELGRVVHLVNGERRLLTEGDLILVRPNDVHTIRRYRTEDFAFVNVAFDRGTLDFLRHRYGDAAEWPWEGGVLPATYHLDRVQLARLGEFATRLLVGRPSRLALECFLLELLHDFIQRPLDSGVPDWLTKALSRLGDDPESLARGVPALALLAGRSREHVNRVIRTATGGTATALVNELRLTRAASELVMTDRPIVRIAAECGLPNLSHFYRLFKTRFGVTPRHYRRGHQALIRGIPAARART